MGIFGQDGHTGKTKHLNIGKKIFDALMRFSKLTAMAFVINKNNAFVFQLDGTKQN